jgi:hypothetical protein
MKIKLSIDTLDGKGPQIVTTNLLTIAEWERTERRKISDGQGIGISDIACWAHTLLKLSDPSLPATWREWLADNPNIEIEVVGDDTDLNPTDAAPTAAS